MSNSSDFSSKLKEARLKKGLSQNAVADKLNISRQAVSGWETGKSMPDINTLPLLGGLYDISIDELLSCEPFISEDNTQNITNSTSHVDTIISNENITKEETDINTAPSSTSNIFNREYVILMLLLIFSSFITFVGLIVSIYILIWTWRNRRHYKLILILSVVCLLIGLNNLFVFIVTSFPVFDSYTIEKVS